MRTIFVSPLIALFALSGCESDSGGGENLTTSPTGASEDSTAGDDSGGDGQDGGDDGPSSTSAADDGDTSGTSSGSTSNGAGDGVRFDVGDSSGTTGTDGLCFGDQECTNKIDLLFVIDNSGTMGEEQLNLARNFPLLIQQLETLENSQGMPANPDVNIMVTTSDFGNPACLKSFYSDGRDPEKGAPISTGCNSRLGRFTFMSNPPLVKENACTDECPTDIEPSDVYIHFDQMGDNVPNGTPAQALACIGPQGIDGCGYESPLETMMQALNPGSTWNMGAAPFLRDDAVLAVVMITDEADCSVKDFNVMTDAMFQNVDPDDGMKKRSSAICWHAGVTCNGPDANGVYTGCMSKSDDKLQPTSRYIGYLKDYLTESQGKEVLMLGILGVPLVTAHAADAPYEPIAGGVFDLVYRVWRDGTYPTGDILPMDAANGETAAHKEFQFEIGPGCTGEDGAGGFTGQAIPPVRIKEVCESLNRPDDPATMGIDESAVRCCIESICDTDFSAAIRCLGGIIQDAIKPQG